MFGRTRIDYPPKPTPELAMSQPALRRFVSATGIGETHRGGNALAGANGIFFLGHASRHKASDMIKFSILPIWPDYRWSSKVRSINHSALWNFHPFAF
jgi:hypothetical protein